MVLSHLNPPQAGKRAVAKRVAEVAKVMSYGKTLQRLARVAAYDSTKPAQVRTPRGPHAVCSTRLPLGFQSECNQTSGPRGSRGIVTFSAAKEQSSFLPPEVLRGFQHGAKSLSILGSFGLVPKADFVLATGDPAGYLTVSFDRLSYLCKERKSYRSVIRTLDDVSSLLDLRIPKPRDGHAD